MDRHRGRLGRYLYFLEPHDATIKVQVGDDVENALISGSQLLARWASSSDAKLNAHQRKTLEAAAATMADASLSPQGTSRRRNKQQRCQRTAHIQSAA